MKKYIFAALLVLGCKGQEPYHKFNIDDNVIVISGTYRGLTGQVRGIDSGLGLSDTRYMIFDKNFVMHCCFEEKSLDFVHK